MEVGDNTRRQSQEPSAPPQVGVWLRGDSSVRRRGTAWRRGRLQTLALLLALLLAVDGFLVPLVTTGTSPAAKPSSLALPAGRDLQQAEPLIPPTSSVAPQELTTQADALTAQIPEARYDLYAQAAVLGPGLEPSFLFVRDRIRYEAYPGILRGPWITFTARAGNAFDRALLLAELLEAQGIATRFATGHLPRDRAEQLFQRIFEPAPAPQSPQTATADSSANLTDHSLHRRLRARALRDYAAIRAALGDALPQGSGPTRDEVLQEIELHAWVQAQVDGQWVDLDPAFGDAVPGQTFCSAEQIFDAFPQELHQRITVRVVVETLEGADLKTATKLEMTEPAEELLDRPLFLLHTPFKAGAPVQALEGALKGARGGELIASKETASRATQALAEGKLLVVPKPVLRGGPLAWWEIAADGTTRAVLEQDLGGWEHRPGVGKGPFGPVDWVYKPPRRPVRPPDQIGPISPGDVTRPGRPRPFPGDPRVNPPGSKNVQWLRGPGTRYADDIAKRAAERGKPRGGGNEYLMMIKDVVIPAVFEAALPYLPQIVGAIIAFAAGVMVPWLSEVITADSQAP